MQSFLNTLKLKQNKKIKWPKTNQPGTLKVEANTSTNEYDCNRVNSQLVQQQPQPDNDRICISLQHRVHFVPKHCQCAFLIHAMGYDVDSTNVVGQYLHRLVLFLQKKNQKTVFTTHFHSQHYIPSSWSNMFVLSRFLARSISLSVTIVHKRIHSLCTLNSIWSHFNGSQTK